MHMHACQCTQTRSVQKWHGDTQHVEDFCRVERKACHTVTTPCVSLTLLAPSGWGTEAWAAVGLAARAKATPLS